MKKSARSKSPKKAESTKSDEKIFQLALPTLQASTARTCYGETYARRIRSRAFKGSLKRTAKNVKFWRSGTMVLR